MELGKQWVFGDKFLIDGYWGLGYGFDNKKSNTQYYYDDAEAYNYANARLGKSEVILKEAVCKLTASFYFLFKIIFCQIIFKIHFAKIHHTAHKVFKLNFTVEHLLTD